MAKKEESKQETKRYHLEKGEKVKLVKESNHYDCTEAVAGIKVGKKLKYT